MCPTIIRSRSRLLFGVGLSAVTLALGACGDDESTTDEDTMGTSATGTTGPGQATAAPLARGLPRALLARCGTKRFAEPVVAPKPYDGVRGWQVDYRVELQSGQQPDPELASIVTIVEVGPEVPGGALEGGQEAPIGGHSVSLQPAGEGRSVHVAQWKTERARYTMLIDGRTLRSLEQFVACMP